MTDQAERGAPSKNADIKALALNALNFARQQLVQGKDVPRIFFVPRDDTGEVNIIAAPTGDPDQEATLVKYFQLLFACWSVARYAIVSEVWVSNSMKYSAENGSAPSEDPNRKEALLVLVVQRSKGESGDWVDSKAMGRAMIHRDPLRVDDLVWDVGEISGRFALLLPPKWLPPVPDSMREMIERILGGMDAKLVPFDEFAAKNAVKH